MADAVPVDAIVIDNPANCDDDGCTWWPRLSLNDPFTVEREVRTRFGASNYGFGQGETVTVLSNPAYPYVRIPGASNLYLLGGGFFLIGFFPLAIAVWLLAKLTFTQPASTQKIE